MGLAGQTRYSLDLNHAVVIIGQLNLEGRSRACLWSTKNAQCCLTRDIGFS